MTADLHSIDLRSESYADLQACRDVPELVDEVRRLRRELDQERDDTAAWLRRELGAVLAHELVERLARRVERGEHRRDPHAG